MSSQHNAPQIGRSRDERDTFWDTLNAVVSRLPTGEVVSLGGDLNGHLGSAADCYARVRG